MFSIPRRRLVLDGIEGVEGRALFLVSTLHHAASQLIGWELMFIRAGDPYVRTAIEALRWDTMLDATTVSDDAILNAFSRAELYVAVCFRDTAHLPLDHVAAAGVPTLLPIQFPDIARHGATALALQRAAHDPAVLCSALLDRLELT
jgi:hypothetical protein